jgi:SAM-dependent methyltransferase
MKNVARRLEPELLDQLPADDPRAMHSRRDLQRINGFMANARPMAAMLRAGAAGRQPRTIVDVGCGDGQAMLRVARRLAPHWRDVHVILQDRQNIVSAATRDAFAALGWHAETVSADVFEFLDRAPATPIDAITANLFLHHFTDAQLTRLFASAARLAWQFVACEPRRAKFVVELSRLLWLVGCNDVSVHDAVTSARAGFMGRELSALWPQQTNNRAWQLHEQPAALFTHLFAARRAGTGAESTS